MIYNNKGNALNSEFTVFTDRSQLFLKKIVENDTTAFDFFLVILFTVQSMSSRHT